MRRHSSCPGWSQGRAEQTPAAAGARARCGRRGPAMLASPRCRCQCRAAPEPELLTVLRSLSYKPGCLVLLGDRARPHGAAATLGGRSETMRTRTFRFTTLTVALLLASAVLACVAQAQPTGASRLTSDDPNNWPMYHRSYDGYRFSPLGQINKTNVKELQVAWVHQSGVITQGLESTPLVIDGVMYYIASNNRVFALDAATGKEI